MSLINHRIIRRVSLRALLYCGYLDKPWHGQTLSIGRVSNVTFVMKFRTFCFCLSTSGEVSCFAVSL